MTTPRGSGYKWNDHYWVEDLLNEAMAAIEKVIEVYGLEAQRQAWQRLQAEKSGQNAKATKHEKNETELYKRVLRLNTEQEKECPGTFVDRERRPGYHRRRMGPGRLAIGFFE